MRRDVAALSSEVVGATGMRCGERMQEVVGDLRRASTWRSKGNLRGPYCSSWELIAAAHEGAQAGRTSGLAIRSELGCEGGRDVLFFTLTPFCCPRGPSAGRPKPGPDYAGMSGHAASKRRGGRCFGEKVTEERRISVDIGCTRERQGKEAAVRTISRYACTL